MYYGQGVNAKNDVQKAYCLNMSSFINSDSDTRIYQGGNISITETNNGYTYSYNIQLVGGRDTNPVNTNFVIKPMCWFSSQKYFQIDTATTGARYKVSTNYTGTQSLYNDYWSNPYTQVAPLVNDVVDFVIIQLLTQLFRLNII